MVMGENYESSSDGNGEDDDASDFDNSNDKS